MEIFNNNNICEDAIFTTKVKWVLLQGDYGVQALRELYARDAIARRNGREGLSYDEFDAFLVACGVRLRPFELQYLCKSFDEGGSGTITATTFVRHLIGLNHRRAKAVEKAWERLEKDEAGNVRCVDLVDTFRRIQQKKSVEGGGAGSNTGLNPMVAPYYSTLLGTMGAVSRGNSVGRSKDSVRGLGGTTATDCTLRANNQSKIDSLTKEEFVAFYTGISQCVPIDETFEVAVLRDWEADDTCRPTLNETKRDWGEHGDPLGDHGPRYVRDAVNMSLGTSTASYNYSKMQRVHPYVEPLPPLDRKDLMRTTCNLCYGSYTRSEFKSADPLATRYGQSI
ncbi:unnamed protein product [Phytomonas sp. EM1]|nr:unnamed protein product [Phytomonas sp. EM1]|eukprot:CCW65307.1 unnamed protein product [Phytomonas sp. isolate EM1]